MRLRKCAACILDGGKVCRSKSDRSKSEGDSCTACADAKMVCLFPDTALTLEGTKSNNALTPEGTKSIIKLMAEETYFLAGITTKGANREMWRVAGQLLSKLWYLSAAEDKKEEMEQEAVDCFRKALEWTGDRPPHLELLLRYHPEARVKYDRMKRKLEDDGDSRKRKLEDDGDSRKRKLEDDGDSSKGAKRIKG